MTHPLSLELEATLQYWQNFAPCLGANVAIYDARHGYWDSASGYAEPNSEEKLASGECFYIYSITKTFTAVVVMRLIEEGLISLDDAICEHFPETALADNISIRHLLNHTSGVPNYTELAGYAQAVLSSPSQPWSFEKLIDLTLQGEMDFPAGEKWHYSNTGYMLLLLLIEKVTGESYGQCIDRYIIDQIGLRHTFVAQDIDKSKLTRGYSRDTNTEQLLEDITGDYNPWWCKTGLIASTAMDVTRFYQALFTSNLVSKESLALMTDAIPINQYAGPHFIKPSYGLGLMIDPQCDFGGSYGHGGDGPGFNSWSAYYPDFYGRAVIITILCNTSMNGHPLFLVKDLLRSLKNNK
ncbi:MAG: serine hydrolase domain-containing protein [Pseudomonadales bacterium]